MIRFEYDTVYDEYNKRKVNIESTKHEDIYEIIDNFVNFLKAISFYDTMIISGFKDAIEKLEEDITDNYIMIQDNDDENEMETENED